MSCTALPSDEAEMNVLYHKIERLDNDLKKREMHLAELIDEVVYAEDNKDKAVRRAEAARYLVNQLENVVQDLLGYLKVLEGNVLLPAFLDLASVVPQDPVVNREVIDETLQKISEDSLTSRTKKLISAVRELPSKTKNRAAREAFMRNVAEESVNVEDTIVLSGLLLEKKDELTALLDDLRDRVRAMLQGNHSELVAGVRSRSVSAGGNISPDYDELREQLRRVTNERDDLQRLASKSENSASIIRVLQEDRKEMEEQLSKAHQQLLKEELKSRRLREQVETLEQSVEQQKHEKELLQGEIKELKREQVNWSRSCAEERRVDEEVQQLRAELDKLVSEHSAARTSMESQVTNIKAQNSILIVEKQELRERMDEKEHQIATLQRANDSFKRELFELQQKMLSSSPPITMNGYGSNGHGAEAAVADMAAELNAMERRMADMSARFQEEHNQIIAQFEEERRRYKAERQECDALVERMANELEQLAIDNRSLRASATLQQL